MPATRHVIHPPGPRWFRGIVALAGGLYLVSVLLGSCGSSLPDDALPRPVRFFTQVACLFPQAATRSIEHRVAGYACSDRRYHDLDHRRYFPIRPDDKENRFERLVHFYRRNLQVMTALDEYLVERHNAAVDRGEDPGDGIEGRIGGILVMSVRTPLPEPGTRVTDYVRTPLADTPKEWRKRRYRSFKKDREERCAVVNP